MVLGRGRGLGRLLLKEAKVKPALPQVVAHGVKLRGIGRRKRFLFSQVDMATQGCGSGVVKSTNRECLGPDNEMF